MSVVRNFGALLVVCNLFGTFITNGQSHLRQDQSLVKRTYQTKTTTNKAMLGSLDNPLTNTISESISPEKDEEIPSLKYYFLTVSALMRLLLAR